MMSSLTLQKWGNSKAIRIPKVVLNALNWDLHEELEFSIGDNKLIIKKIACKHRSIEEMFEGYSGNYVPEEVDWGDKVGKEVW